MAKKREERRFSYFNSQRSGLKHHQHHHHIMSVKMNKIPVEELGKKQEGNKNDQK